MNMGNSERAHHVLGDGLLNSVIDTCNKIEATAFFLTSSRVLSGICSTRRRLSFFCNSIRYECRMRGLGTYRLLTFWGRRSGSKGAVGVYLIAQSADKMWVHGQRRVSCREKESQGHIMIFGASFCTYPVLGVGSNCEVPGTCDNERRSANRDVWTEETMRKWGDI